MGISVGTQFDHNSVYFFILFHGVLESEIDLQKNSRDHHHLPSQVPLLPTKRFLVFCLQHLSRVGQTRDQKMLKKRFV